MYSARSIASTGSSDEDDTSVAVTSDQNPLASDGILHQIPSSAGMRRGIESRQSRDTEAGLFEHFPAADQANQPAGQMAPLMSEASSPSPQVSPSKAGKTATPAAHVDPTAAVPGGPGESEATRVRGMSLFQGQATAGDTVSPQQGSFASQPATTSQRFGSPSANNSMTAPTPTSQRQLSASPRASTSASPQQGQGATPPTPPEKRTITMEFGDEYVGDVAKMPNTSYYVPHGSGTLHSITGGHSYVGEFKLRLREGQGKLVTNDCFLWCKWKDNRPDWTSSVRVDYTNGEKYCGYLSAVTDPQAQAKLKKDKTPLSKFSHWVKTTVLVRERWGEMVFADGSRYFGQWESNQPDGFGCAILENGDRYIGNWWKGKYHGAGTLFSSKRSKRMTGGGLLYDGIWEKGVFDAEEGHVTFPCRTRLTGEWKNSVQATTASVHHPGRQDTAKRWVTSFQWETLLCGCQDAAKNRDIASAIPIRNKILKATTREEVESLCRQLIKENPSIGNSLKIFRRCFYFMYGTCGSSSEIGAGLGNNRLGWCFVRSTFGGCIHRGRGKAITTSDVDNGLGDVSSFVGSLRRWINELVGENAAEVIYDFDADVPITRYLLDIVLTDVHQPLFNLYVQSYRKEQVQLTAALRRLHGVTPDDLGVLFGRHVEEKLFSPYEDAIRSLQGLSKVHSLNAKLSCLKKMSADIDLSTRLGQMKLDGVELTRLSTFVRDRRDATGESLHAMSSPRAEGGEEAEAMAPLISKALSVQSGSADDLLPIHQYVLMEANIPYLFSHVQMLLDLSADENYIDGTSQDAFCITTLHACTTILPQLHKNIRDAQGVITPLAVYEKRVEDSLNFEEETQESIMLWLPAVLASLGTVTLPLTDATVGAMQLVTVGGNIMGLSIAEIVPSLAGRLSPTTSSSPTLSKSRVGAKLAARAAARQSQERTLVQRHLKAGITVLQNVDVQVYRRTARRETATGIEIDAELVQREKASNGHLVAALENDVAAEDLFVVPPKLSSSVCVELAQFISGRSN